MKILHVFRTPVGGLFRHVRDLVRGQSQLGHDVGILCDSSTGGTVAETLLNQIRPFCTLGIQRIGISRLPGLGDVSAALQTKSSAEKIGAEVIHGHGAKGGLYGRIAARALGVLSVYTPHGGSLHYNWLGFPGGIFLATEWALGKIGTGMLFVCQHERESFMSKIGLDGKRHAVVFNGLWPDEFSKVEPRSDASDVFFIGDMRLLKGVDILLEAIALLKLKRPITANFVGDGPDLARFQRQSEDLGLSQDVRFLGRLPTAEALKCGRLLVMPSRAESFPYVVLEAGAGQVPIIACDVGGISEMLPRQNLCPPDNARSLARHIEMALAIPQATAQDAQSLSQSMQQTFSAEMMAKGVTAFYAELKELPAR